MSAPSGEGSFRAQNREWTGSCKVLPEALRLLAQEFAAKAMEHRSSPLSSYLQDHAYTLNEWGDAVELLYARLDTEGDVPTNAQGIALAEFLRRGFRTQVPALRWANVAQGGMGLGEDYLLIRMADGFTGGIDREGRTST